MGTIDEIKRMKKEWTSETDISTALRGRGVSEQEISDGLAQSRIKEAVNSSGDYSQGAGLPYPSQNQQSDEYSYQSGSQPYSQQSEIVGGAPSPSGYGMDNNSNYDEMQPSLLEQGQAGNEQYQPLGAQDSYQSYPPENYEGYSQYQPYQDTGSSELMSEVAEQIVSEKLFLLRDKIDKISDFGVVVESKISSLSERLKRIEQIIDNLQLSVLHRVGEYVNDVKDIKQEME